MPSRLLHLSAPACVLVLAALTALPAHADWDEAGEADRMFSLLMGENVEDRRKFIEDHALEVKMLDI